jgi:hypothetical protein
MESGSHIGGKEAFMRTRGRKTDPMHMPVLGGMTCTNIRFGMMWLSKPVNSLPYLLSTFMVGGCFTTIGRMVVQIAYWVFFYRMKTFWVS